MSTDDRTEVLLRRAYDDLAARPEDATLGGTAFVEVNRRIERSRRRRRGTVVGVALASAAGVAAVAGTAALGVWGEDTGRDGAGQVAGSGEPDVLTVSAPGVASRSVGGLTASCEDLAIGGQTVTVIRADTVASDGTIVRFQAEVDKLTPGRALAFPLDDLGAGAVDTPRYLELLVVLPRDGAAPLEASSTGEDPRGSITVGEARCGAEPALRLALDLSVQTDPAGTRVQVTGPLTAVS